MNGAELIALTITAALYGIISGQVLVYLRRNCRDRLALKVMVVVIWGLESAHVVFTAISAWRWAIIYHANPISAHLTSWHVPAAQATMNFSIAMVQYIWIMRIWKLNLSRYRSVMAICMLALLAIDTVLAAAWAGLVFFAEGKPLDRHPSALVWVAPATLSIQILNDVLATSLLCATLHRTGIYRGNALITKVIVCSLNTGFLTCISAIAILIAWLEKGGLYCQAVWLATSKIYAISLLAMLNWRPARTTETETGGGGFELTTVAEEIWDTCRDSQICV